MGFVTVITEDLTVTDILVIAFAEKRVGDGFRSVDQPSGIVVGSIGGLGDFLEFAEAGEIVIGV